MFENKKFRAIFIYEFIAPWLVAVFGVPAVCFDQRKVDIYYENAMQGIYEESEAYLQAEAAFDIFYGIAMLSGFVVILSLAVIGVASLVTLIIRLRQTMRQPYTVARCITLTLCAPLCIVGTLVLMLILLAFTYGQGV